MNVKIRNIAIDAATADRLEARARARGMSPVELLADFAAHEEPPLAWSSPGHDPWSPEGLAEDARRLAEFEATRVGVPWDEMKAWMETWGTSAELPPPTPRKL